MYHCYLNGKLYGKGSLEYMSELFRSYVVDSKMYGHDTCDFVIVKAIRDIPEQEIRNDR